MQARRNKLKNVNHSAKPSHAGLWFDRYLANQLPKGNAVDSSKGTPQQALIAETCAVPVPEIYKTHYESWKQALQNHGASCWEASVQGRMAVGLGAESVIETAVRLHHTYGVPFIPGSALKGLASTYAHQQLADPAWRKGGQAHAILFGTPEEAGFITFHDALFVPGSSQPLYPDVITVHHPDYYQDKQDAAPADWDDPNPISFISATGKYLVALEGEYPIWVQAAFNILQAALREYGVGAKTSSGYGRMILGQKNNTAAAEKKVETAPPPGYERGRVKKTFGAGTGQSYGFIAPDSGGKDVFIHQNYLPAHIPYLSVGQYVYFHRVKSDKNDRAEDVRLA